MDVFKFALYIGTFLDLIGVVIILIGVIISSVIFVKDFFSPHHSDIDIYKTYRTNLGRSILLGLEVLVAGDIIRSVVGQPSFDTVGILVIIVLVRSFLSVTFDMEIEGHWPWKRRAS